MNESHEPRANIKVSDCVMRIFALNQIVIIISIIIFFCIITCIQTTLKF